jgi:hypothetical protein
MCRVKTIFSIHLHGKPATPEPKHRSPGRQRQPDDYVVSCKLTASSRTCWKRRYAVPSGRTKQSETDGGASAGARNNS